MQELKSGNRSILFKEMAPQDIRMGAPVINGFIVNYKGDTLFVEILDYVKGIHNRKIVFKSEANSIDSLSVEKIIPI